MAKKQSPGAALAHIRWAKATEADRQKAREAGMLGGRPRSDAKRCHCGEMTAKRAKARGHKCERVK